MDDKIENSDANSAECTKGGECGRCCSSTGLSKRRKIIVCLIIAIAAAIVLAHGVMQRAESESDLWKTSPDAALWGEPVASLSSLNQAISQTDAVFLYLPSAAHGQDEKDKNVIGSTAIKAQSQGTSTAFFALDEDSEDYLNLTSQEPAPLVLIITKGCNLSAVSSNISEERAMSIVSGNISEENLLYALVAASRPAVGCCLLPSKECC